MGVREWSGMKMRSEGEGKWDEEEVQISGQAFFFFASSGQFDNFWRREIDLGQGLQGSRPTENTSALRSFTLSAPIPIAYACKETSVIKPSKDAVLIQKLTEDMDTASSQGVKLGRRV